MELLFLIANLYQTITPANHQLKTVDDMPPKKKVERAATENISLGPQVREGEPCTRTCLSWMLTNPFNR